MYTAELKVIEMGFTTIRYGNAQFVANDLPIEVWLLEVARQIDGETDVAPWLSHLKEEWNLQATSGFDFGPSPALDSFLDADDRRQQLSHYFRKALESLSRRDSDFTPDELSESGVGGPEAIYSKDLPVQMVIEVGNQFLALIS